MAEAELLEKVKTQLNITGNYQDETLKGYIREVQEYLRDAGVKDEVINSPASVGVIARGVSDIWNFGSGSVNLSSYFKERVIQLTFKEV